MSLPPLRTIAEALRKTTETIACELAVPSMEPPDWTEFEWNIARAASAMHGVSALLNGRLQWEGPELWQRFLRDQTDHSVARHQKIKDLLESIDHGARRRGVAIVALKGAALYASKIYLPGERPMGDIDLLVAESDANTMTRILEECGHEAAYATQRHQVYQPRSGTTPAQIRLGEHRDSPIKVEVHTRIAERLPVTAHDITQFLVPIAAHEGVNAYPSEAALMMHLLLHAAGNMRPRALRLIQLHDIALLAARLSAADWELLADGPGGRSMWWALAPLMLTARYYPMSLSAGVYSRFGVECPRYLRARAQRQLVSDVSWSRIRIEAFPGLEWSGSAAEAVAFMTSRIWPSHAARLELREGAAQIPESSTIPWYGISHRARVLRWIFSTPPRVQTLLCVRKALAREA